MKDKQLYRSCSNRILGGVCGGLGEYFEIDPVVIRLVFVLLAFTGVGIITYLIAWVIIPSDPSCTPISDKSEIKNDAKEAASEIRGKAQEFAEEIKKTVKDKKYHSSDGRLIIGMVLLALGVMALFQSIFHVNLWNIFWPAILIILGFVFLAQTRKK